MNATRKSIWTPANIVTMCRIVLIPVFVFVLMAPWPSWFPYWEGASVAKPWLSAAVFGLLSATDGVDGYLARSRNEVTTFGKFLDPLADKILVCAALLALCELGTLPSWIALVIVAREFIISGLRMLASVKGIVIAASWYGKAKTFVTIIAIILFIIKDSSVIASAGLTFANGFDIFSWFVMIAAVVLTILSMLDYFAKASDEIGLFAAEEDDGTHDSSLIARDVLDKATSAHLTIGTAESCTGGKIAASLTDIPGSSTAFMGSIVSYDNAVKINRLGVSSETLNDVGAVSSEVARQMACGAIEALGVDIAVATTGIAGPDGGTKEKPVGLVWLGVATKQGCQTEKWLGSGSREDIRDGATSKALTMLQEALSHGDSLSLNGNG